MSLVLVVAQLDSVLEMHSACCTPHKGFMKKLPKKTEKNRMRWVILFTRKDV